MQREELVFIKNGVEYMKLCVDVTAYWIGPFREQREGLLAFYHKAIDTIKPALTYFETHDMTGAEPIRPDTLDLLPRWLNEEELENEIYTLTLETNSAPNLPSDMAFRFCAVPFKGRRVGVLRLVQPVTLVEEGPTALEEIACELLSEMQFHSGHAGYALNCDHRGDYGGQARRAMGMIGPRFPGIELPDELVTLMAIPSGIKRVNWLTALGSSLIGKLGGLRKIELTFENLDILIHELNHGVLIRAGRQPGLGDRNRNEDLEAYHAVGHVLSAVRSHEHPPFLGSANLDIDDERSEQWLAHFD